MPTRILPDVEALRPLVGQEVGVSDWLEITQEMIDRFADITGDRQWIHCDTERARRESPFGTTIAHGFFSLSVLSQLHAKAVHIQAGVARLINYGLNRVRFPAPVRAGSRIRARSTLQAFEQQAESIQITWLMTIEVDNSQKPAVVAEWLLRYYRT